MSWIFRELPGSSTAYACISNSEPDTFVVVKYVDSHRPLRFRLSGLVRMSKTSGQKTQIESLLFPSSVFAFKRSEWYYIRSLSVPQQSARR